ncbi:unnamed protein product [Phytomonas sp. EM1]|nr:unnamed protein product [Phytomonas sp. EM1]|eukprot:CCW61708.1 unnamed protein product [Phytomonas sp. isolate EM1]
MGALIQLVIVSSIESFLRLCPPFENKSLMRIVTPNLPPLFFTLYVRMDMGIICSSLKLYVVLLYSILNILSIYLSV